MSASEIEIVNDAFLRQPWLQASRFTDAATMMLRHSIERALDRGMFGILPPALVIWSMLRWERKVPVLMLEKAVADMRAFEADVESLLTSDGRPLDVDASKISELAYRAKTVSDRLGHSHVGTEHLLLAVGEVDDVGIRDLFSKYKLSHETLTHALFDILTADENQDSQ